MSRFQGCRRLIFLLFGSAGGGAGAIAAASIFQADSKPHSENEAGLAWLASNRQKWNDNWDRRAPIGRREHSKSKAVENGGVAEDNQPAKATASRHIILIRHGQYNTSALLDSDRMLTELGREQAELCGARLRDLGLPYTRVVTSTMTRAIETGNIICKYLSNNPALPVERCSMLREGAPIEPEPAVGHYHPEAQQYYEDGARIEAAFRRYIHRADADQKEDSFDVLVCHANVIRYFVCRALQFPPEAWLRITLNNGSITWLVVRPNGRVTLRALGDSLFMPTVKMSSG